MSAVTSGRGRAVPRCCAEEEEGTEGGEGSEGDDWALLLSCAHALALSLALTPTHLLSGHATRRVQWGWASDAA